MIEIHATLIIKRYNQKWLYFACFPKMAGILLCTKVKLLRDRDYLDYDLVI